MSSYKGHLSIVQYLVDTCHVPPDQPDNSNNTALLYSAMGGHSDLVEFFIERNCNTSQINSEGASLSLLACQSGKLALIHKLEELNLFSLNSIDDDGHNVLHYSVKHNSIEIYQYLLTRVINMKNPKGNTPLKRASWHASSSVVEYIVSIQGNEALLVTGNNGYSCLHSACSSISSAKAGMVYHKVLEQLDAPIICSNNTFIRHNFDFIKRNERVKMFSSLLKKASTCPNFDINATTNDGNSLLHLASRSGSTLLMKALEEYKINCTLDNNGVSPVHYAAWSGSTSVLSYIISQYNLNANDTDYTYGHTPLVYSCQSGSINSVKYLINNHNSDPNITDKEGMTCLHHSCRHGHIDITQYLIEVQHCDINKTDNEGCTLVHHAAQSGNFDLVQYLITEQGLSPTAVDKNGLTALHYASVSLNLSLVKELITTYQLDPHQADSNGKLPIHYAAQSGDILLLELYVKDYECSLSLTDNKGSNILHYSSSGGHTHFIKHLVENHQLDLCAVNDNGMAPIHLACSNGRLNLVQYIIEHVPSSLELPVRGHGHTPFLTAVYFNQLEVIKYLISKKCNLSATDGKGSGAVHISVEEGHLNVLKYLIDNNYCNPNATNHQDRTPLHLAVLTDQVETIKYLMCESVRSISMVWLRETKYSLDGPHNINTPDGLPVDVNAKDKDGITCLHLIAEKGNIKMYEYLKYHYKSIPRDNFGRTPLHYSCLSNKYDMTMYLVKSCHYYPDDTDNNGYNSVHAACQVGNFELVLYFLTEHGCNPQAETNDEQTLLYFAIKSSNSELVQFLKQVMGLRPRWHEIEAAEPVSSEVRPNPGSMNPNVTSERKAKNGNKCLLS